MTMFKKWWISFCQAMTLSLLLALLVSLISVNIQIKSFYWILCILLPTHVFNFFTFEMRLFSKHLWVRRAISMCFSVVTILTTSTLFGYMRWNDKRDWLIYGISLSIMLLVSVFTYYVLDKIEKRKLDAINPWLAIEHARK